jgi:phage terminase large subunit-like protein
MRADNNITWIQDTLFIPDGPLMGQKFMLLPFQQKIIRAIYETPTRRAIISFGRKNGKTALAAALLLLHLCGNESRPNSELFSSALSRDQAGILFRLAPKIVRLSPKLWGQVIIRDTVKQLYCPGRGTLYTALSADASTNMGLSPVFICHDELGQVRGSRHTLYEALETATGAQEEPLSIVISTQSPNDADLLSVLIDDALADNDPRTKIALYSTPENDPSGKEDDPRRPWAFSKKAIKLANPAFGSFQNDAEILDMAANAKRMPSREAEYRNLILNQRVEAQSPFVSKYIWEKNGAPPGKMGAIYGGLDLSSVNDLTAFVMVSVDEDGMINVEPVFWLPREGLKERAMHDRVLYDVWHENKFLETTPGWSIDYEYVANYLAKTIATRDVRRIGFDKWNMKHLRPWLIRAGMTESLVDSTFTEFGQGWYSMSPALNALESALLEGRIRHGDHPLLRMCANNAVVKMDEAGNRKLDKKHSRGRIDGMVALAMAVSLAVSKSHEKHVYQVPMDQILETV